MDLESKLPVSVLGTSPNYVRGLLAQTHEPITLDELRAQLQETQDVFNQEAHRTFPRRWKSLLSGKTRVLRFDDPYIYGETVLSVDERQRGDFVTYEFKKTESGYSGLYRARGSCWAKWIQQVNQCAMEGPIDFTLVTPTRIEGRSKDAGPGNEFDCRRCKFKKPLIWTDFVWVPE